MYRDRRRAEKAEIMPDINKFMSNALVRDKVFMHLSPRDVINYQSATGITFTTEEFERYVNVFRFIIPQRRWLMDKINNEGYTFTVICKTLHDFPNSKKTDDTLYLYLFVTDKNGDFVSCSEDFIPKAVFKSNELDIGVFRTMRQYHPWLRTCAKRLLVVRFGDVLERVLVEMPANIKFTKFHGAMPLRSEFVSGTLEKSQIIAKYSGPMLKIHYRRGDSVNHVFRDMQWEHTPTAARPSWDMLPNESWSTMYAVMDSNGYTIKHLLPKRLRLRGSREYSNRIENIIRKRLITWRTRIRRLKGEKVEQKYDIQMSSEEDLEGSCSSPDPTASSEVPDQQKKKIETLFSLQVLYATVEWPYKGLIYHIPGTKADCSDKYEGLYRAPVENRSCANSLHLSL